VSRSTPAAGTAVAAAIAAIRTDKVVILPTDTVYGLVSTAYGPAARDAVYRLKGRDPGRPSALMAASLEVLLDCVPELRGRSERMASALLPGPYTLVLPNPAGRFAWLCGHDAASIGVRVPALAGPGGDVLDAVGAIVATSANVPGGPEPRTVEEIPEALRGGAAVVVDGGELRGVPSTVLDLTGAEPRLVREGAGGVAAALERLAALV
jgi:L-threonylcarbamoyladenylate synthase